jgi:hypothetical protein
MKNFLSLISLIFFVLIAFGSLEEFEGLDDGPKITSHTKPNVTVSARKLYKEYNANEIAADEKYKGQIIQVSGIIRDIGNDIMDNAYVTLIGDQYFGDIQCYFNEKSIVAGLSKGKRITVIGSCSGLMMNVQINNCIIK